MSNIATKSEPLGSCPYQIGQQSGPMHLQDNISTIFSLPIDQQSDQQNAEIQREPSIYQQSTGQITPTMILQVALNGYANDMSELYKQNDKLDENQQHNQFNDNVINNDTPSRQNLAKVTQRNMLEQLAPSKTNNEKVVLSDQILLPQQLKLDIDQHLVANQSLQEQFWEKVAVDEVEPEQTPVEQIGSSAIQISQQLEVSSASQAQFSKSFAYEQQIRQDLITNNKWIDQSSKSINRRNGYIDRSKSSFNTLRSKEMIQEQILSKIKKIWEDTTLDDGNHQLNKIGITPDKFSDKDQPQKFQQKQVMPNQVTPNQANSQQLCPPENMNQKISLSEEFGYGPCTEGGLLFMLHQVNQRTQEMKKIEVELKSKVMHNMAQDSTDNYNTNQLAQLLYNSLHGDNYCDAVLQKTIAAEPPMPPSHSDLQEM